MRLDKRLDPDESERRGPAFRSGYLGRVVRHATPRDVAPRCERLQVSHAMIVSVTYLIWFQCCQGSFSDQARASGARRHKGKHQDTLEDTYNTFCLRVCLLLSPSLSLSASVPRSWHSSDLLLRFPISLYSLRLPFLMMRCRYCSE